MCAVEATTNGLQPSSKLCARELWRIVRYDGVGYTKSREACTQLIYYSDRGVILTYSCFQPSTWRIGYDQNIASSSMKCPIDMYATPWVGILRPTMSCIRSTESRTTACVTRVYVGFDVTAHTRPKNSHWIRRKVDCIPLWDWWATLIICFCSDCGGTNFDPTRIYPLLSIDNCSASRLNGFSRALTLLQLPSIIRCKNLSPWYSDSDLCAVLRIESLVPQWYHRCTVAKAHQLLHCWYQECILSHNQNL